MPTHHYITTEPAPSTYGLGHRGSDELVAQYSNSPIFNGDYTAAKVVLLFETLEFPATLNDGGAYFGTVDRHYTNSPDLTTVAVGGGGLPGSPYAPNPASPADGTANPGSIPAVVPRRGAGGAFQGDGLASPNTSAARIGRQRLGNLILGRSTPA